MQVVGIDTGGTFTDFVVDETVLKVRSTPADPAQAILEGLAALGLSGRLRIVHGTTVATNALLTGSGARTAFVTTRGLEDLLEVGRQDRAQLYALQPRAHDPIVAPKDRFGVQERLHPDGAVETPLQPGNLVEQVKASGVSAVAVCLLHAYRILLQQFSDHVHQSLQRYQLTLALTMFRLSLIELLTCFETSARYMDAMC